MKGLILKDFYIIRFQLVVASIGALMVAYLCYSGAHSIGPTCSLFGYVGRILIPAMFDYVVIVFGSSFFLNTIAEDFSSGWVKQQRTLPVSDRQAIGAKLISTYILIGALALFAIGFNLVFWLRYGGTPEIMLTAPLCVGLIQVITLSPVFPLGQRYGVKSADTVYILLEIIMAIIAVVLMFPALSEEIPMLALRIAFYAVLPILAAASCAVSFAASKSLLRFDAEV